jgi:hypothetical protein
MNLFGHEVTEDVVKLAFKDVLESVYKAIVSDSAPLFISSLSVSLLPLPPLLCSSLDRIFRQAWLESAQPLRVSPAPPSPAHAAHVALSSY